MSDLAPAVLKEARVFVERELRGLLECFCVLDKDFKPIESTMNEAEARDVQKIRDVLARIDAVLQEGDQ